MIAKLLKSKITIAVKPVPHWNHFPACARPEHCPAEFKEKLFSAEAWALWGFDDFDYVAIVKDGKRLIVPMNFIHPEEERVLFDNTEDDYVSSPSDIERYGKEEFAEDIVMMSGEFDAKIHSVEITVYGADIVHDCKWSLNGHVKPVVNLNRQVFVEDTGKITCLPS